MLETVITSGALAAMIIEGIKWIIRYAKKDMLFEFPVKFYAFLLPVLTYAVEPLLAYLGVGEYVLPSDWRGWVIQLVVVALSSLAAMATYKISIKGMAHHAQDRMT